MASKVTCAGGCGKLLYTGTGSLPAGVRSCRECRAAGRAPVPPRTPAPRPERGCDEPSCERKHLAAGLCALHYHRDRRARGLEGGSPPALTLNGVAWLHGVYAPKVKTIRCRVTVGVLADCPRCDTTMGATSSTDRICPACFTTVRLNEEEVEWATSEKRSTAA